MSFLLWPSPNMAIFSSFLLFLSRTGWNKRANPLVDLNGSLSSILRTRERKVKGTAKGKRRDEADVQKEKRNYVKKNILAVFTLFFFLISLTTKPLYR